MIDRDGNGKPTAQDDIEEALEGMEFQDRPEPDQDEPPSSDDDGSDSPPV
jgi:hypothetical protein